MALVATLAISALGIHVKEVYVQQDLKMLTVHSLTPIAQRVLALPLLEPVKATQ